ncbi:MAG: hypothetical protein PWP23_675 [Candidatus Sumerlaeota bacterium]|nr:hypothetical protein [Candidatus Sumerlaeota bacterium]
MNSAVRIEPLRELPRLALSPAARILRVLGFAAITCCFLVLFSGGGPESRYLFALAGLLGLANPVWSLYAIALLGGIYLNSSGAYYLNVLIEALVLGAFLGELRTMGQVDRDLIEDPHVLRGADASSPEIGRTLRLNWGAWPAVGVGILFLAWASAVPSLVYSIFEEGNTYGVSWLRYTTHKIVWGWESDVQWGIRAALNWTMGVGLAALAARRATAFRVSRFFKFGALGLLLCCVAGLLELACQKLGKPWFSLTELRPLNLYPYQEGRFQATAGHAGWFGQWIVLLWPGIVLFALHTGRIKKLAAGLALLLVFFCLVLTGARAAWLGMLASLGSLAAFLLLTRVVPARTIFKGMIITLAVIVGVGALAYVAGGNVLGERMLRTLNLSGRENYLSSGVIFLRQFPFGIGLGQHFNQYHTWFTDVSYHYFQPDHVTAHCFPLHLVVETGPFLLLLFFGAVFCFVLEFLKAWPNIPADHRFLALIPAIVLIGIMADGVAQFFFYVRVIEFGFWIIAGWGLGLYRRYSPRASSPRFALVSPALLVASGLAAGAVAFSHFQRPLLDAYPRPWEVACSELACSNAKWTAKSARFPIEPDAVAVEFTLYRVGLPTRVHITWPDGEVETLDMPVEGWVRLKKELTPTGGYARFEHRRWVQIDCDVTYTPKRWEPGNLDGRPLGVFVNEFFVWFPWHLAPPPE